MMRSSKLVWRGLVVAVLFLFVAGCGEKSTEIQSSDSDGPNRYDELEPLDLEPGEAKQGMHLRPGIEMVSLDFASTSEEVELDYPSRTVSVRGEARDQVEQAGEIWSEDILMGEDFIFLIVDVRETDNALIIEVEPFELLRVIHGEWDLEFDPEPGSPLMATIDSDGTVTVGLADTLGDSVSASVGGSASAELEGELRFPIEWDGEFRGKVSYRGYGLNADYECAEYTETVTRRRYVFGPEETVEREVQPEHFCLDYLLVKGTIGLEANGSASLEAEDISFDVSNKEEFFGFRTPLGVTGLALYWEPFIKAGLEAQFSGTEELFTLGMTGDYSLSIPLGFEYDKLGDGFSLLPNDRHPIEQSGGLDYELDGGDVDEASLTLYSQLGIGLALSDVATSDGVRITGPEAGIEYGTEATAESTGDDSSGGACLTLAAYVAGFGNANLGAEVRWRRWSIGYDDVLSLGSVEKRIELDREEVDGEACTEPPTGRPEQLDLSLRWSEETLLDLYLETPEGNVIAYDNNTDDGGEYISVAPNADCLNDGSTECEAVTNWDLDETLPPLGEYEVWVTNVDGEQSANFELDAETEFESLGSWSGSLDAQQDAESQHYNFTVSDDS